ncbi:MAG: primosomal protein N' [Chloroflexi bacterium]|nr:primosomal protein N' [Chloroflexota bacterium]
MKYAEVAVDAPAGNNRTFTYSIPPDLTVSVGQVVRVPFGSRRLQGVVFSLEKEPNFPQTRDIADVVEDVPTLTDAQLGLVKWMSDYYMCSLFEAAALMLPPGSRVRAKVRISLTPEGQTVSEESLTDAQKRVVSYLRNRGEIDQTRLARGLGDWAARTVSSLAKQGLVQVRGASERPTIAAKYERQLAVALEPAQVREKLDSLTRAPRQKALLEALGKSSEPMNTTAARSTFGASSVKALLEKGWVVEQEERVYRDPLAAREFDRSGAPKLTKAQGAAAEVVGSALVASSARPRMFLLHGVTGSGKTEVYMDALTRCIASGKKAIFLVPEIALTHQTIERLEGRFPGKVAVQHSKLKPGERFDQWWEIKNGSYDIVVGSRGAVFAPQPDLGLIVIDEEHEWTYKQEDANPRYHARDVALRLSALTNAVVVMGSASPDVLSYRRTERGIFKLLSLPERITTSREGKAGPAPLAEVEIVDMRREARDGSAGTFSRTLLGELKRCLDAGEQAILFLNRRGTASQMMCRGCGYIVKCRRCDVALRYHKDQDRLVCHHCGLRKAPFQQCPQCLTFKLDFYGIGTEGLVSEVEKLFPKVKVLRWDRDATQTPEDMERLLTTFRSGKAQVLVGTQMIAKGLHFPQVTLVGVVSADTGLGVPDFRAGERTFQVLCQVAGRAGRGSQKGRVVFQTYQPEHYAVRAAASQDYASFYRQELDARRSQGYPPFSRVINLQYQHTNRMYVEEAATELAKAFREERDSSGMGDPLVLGPVPGFPPRLRGRYRWQVSLRGLKPRALLDKIVLPHGWTVDVDPVAP